LVLVLIFGGGEHVQGAGDIPIIYSTSGRAEVPVPALLDLYEAVQADGGDSHRYPLAPTMVKPP
jgi:hypothetical protein